MSRILALIAGVLLFVAGVHAQIPGQRDALKKLSIASIKVEMPDDADFQKLAFTENQVRIDVELKLRQASIPLSASLDDRVPSFPRLYVAIRAVKTEGVYSYQVKAQIVTLVNSQLTAGEPAKLILACAWESDVVGLIGGRRISEIRADINDAINELVNDYLAANPKPKDRGLFKLF